MTWRWCMSCARTLGPDEADHLRCSKKNWCVLDRGHTGSCVGRIRRSVAVDAPQPAPARDAPPSVPAARPLEPIAGQVGPHSPASVISIHADRATAPDDNGGRGDLPPAA